MERTKIADIAKTVAPRSSRESGCGFLPSGSTLLNCAMSDIASGGVGMGKIINIIGDSSAGKTMICETMLAEIANNPEFDDYALYLDDAEHAMEMDIAGLFGTKAANRITSPRVGKDGLPLNSDTVEQFFANIMALIKAGKPFVYCLDSLDSLTDAAEYEAADDLVKMADGLAEKSSEETSAMGNLAMAGSYNMTKQKLLSQVLRTVKAGLSKTNSVLVIISQTRANINARPGQPTKKRSGGNALEFYCSHVCWLSAVKTHKAGKKGMEEIIGRNVECKISKNKITGKARTVSFDIFYSYGVDDIGSCVDFLADYGVISKKGAYLSTEAFGLDGKNMLRKDLINHLEESALFNELRELVQKAWDEKESALDLGRKRRFE